MQFRITGRDGSRVSARGRALSCNKAEPCSDGTKLARRDRLSATRAPTGAPSENRSGIFAGLFESRRAHPTILSSAGAALLVALAARAPAPTPAPSCGHRGRVRAAVPRFLRSRKPAALDSRWSCSPRFAQRHPRGRCSSRRSLRTGSLLRRRAVDPVRATSAGQCSRWSAGSGHGVRRSPRAPCRRERHVSARARSPLGRARLLAPRGRVRDGCSEVASLCPLVQRQRRFQRFRAKGRRCSTRTSPSAMIAASRLLSRVVNRAILGSRPSGGAVQCHGRVRTMT
jgi:hypothetical protein